MFNIEIEYVPGKLNVVPDCLSRLTSNDEIVGPEGTLGMHVFVNDDGVHWLN